MSMESLEELSASFKKWRLKKRYATESVPADLVARARRAVGMHGITLVAKATKINRIHLIEQKRGKKAKLSFPGYSRVEISAAGRQNSPVAELETGSGMKLRIFSLTAETMELMSSFCRAGGVS
jgi:hypothetical protein